MSLCPFCGAYSTRQCDLIDDAGHCPWEEVDNMRDDAHERERLRRECPDSE